MHYIIRWAKNETLLYGNGLDTTTKEKVVIDVEKLAREAGIVTDGLSFARGQIDDLSRFAAIVLEAAAVQCEKARPSGGRVWSTEQAAVFEALTHVAQHIRSMKPGEGND
jgi:hypothetical protein